ncbi:hypothetical protein LAZ67_3000157 [Cordylochernes scorpioides]|uniref:Histone-lysine N-methyltransferase SETMAR n=1 Tax=Cordylochernes scorpioides TaxID=51811 RepID=A0ABY6KAN6_9ARAC|nr:hypothetical protein LAZ67_3000157 [Cordylochernes scorpioides]
MNSDLYCDILVNKLKPGIRNKRRGKLSKGVLFLHNNARPHTSCKTVSTIIKLGFEVLEHPAYSPDLAPSVYFLFGLLKKELKGKRFDSDEDVQKVHRDKTTIEEIQENDLEQMTGDLTDKNGSMPGDHFIEEPPGEAIERLLESCRTSGDHICEDHSTDQESR